MPLKSFKIWTYELIWKDESWKQVLCLVWLSANAESASIYPWHVLVPFFSREAIEAQGQELNSFFDVQQHLGVSQQHQRLLAAAAASSNTQQEAGCCPAATLSSLSSSSAHTPIVPLQQSSCSDKAVASGPSCYTNSLQHRSRASSREESPAVRSKSLRRVGATDTSRTSTEVSCKEEPQNCSDRTTSHPSQQAGCFSSSNNNRGRSCNIVDDCDDDSDCSSSQDVDIEGNGSGSNVDIVSSSGSSTEDNSTSRVNEKIISSCKPPPPGNAIRASLQLQHPQMQFAAGAASSHHRLSAAAVTTDSCCPSSQVASLGGACSNNSTSSVSTEPGNDEMFEALGLYN